MQRWWAVAVLSLLIVTWRLWAGSLLTADTAFPTVPMFGLPGWLLALDRWLVLPIASSLVLAACFPGHRSVYLVVLASLGLAFVLNQHRLQPWAYQAAVQALLFACLPPRKAWRWMRWFLVSTYFFSALGKFDYQFLHTVGQQFVALILGTEDGPPTTIRLALAALLPIAELSIACLLLLPMTQRLASACAASMHLMLILILGPLGANHSLGVLLWNAWLSGFVMFLFWKSPANLTPEPPQSRSTPTRFGTLATRAVMVAVLLLPFSERFGYWDHWLSWSLYSPHTSRVEVEIHQSQLGRLPANLRALMAVEDETAAWQEVPLGTWSLHSLGVPVYPNSRFQLGVAIELAQPLDNPAAIRAKVRSTADRWNGTRTDTYAVGLDQIKRISSSYWLLPTSERPAF